jgi:hypothetical protein
MQANPCHRPHPAGLTVLASGECEQSGDPMVIHPSGVPMPVNRAINLDSRPTGRVEARNRFVEGPAPKPGAGEVLVGADAGFPIKTESQH